MVESSFQIVRGIGPTRERRLWQAGIARWSDYGAAPEAQLSHKADRALRAAIDDATAALAARDVDRLASLLPSGEHWRLFDAFGADAAYLDIETSDDVVGFAGISAIGILDRERAAHPARRARPAPLPRARARLVDAGDLQRARRSTCRSCGAPFPSGSRPWRTSICATCWRGSAITAGSRRSSGGCRRCTSRGPLTCAGSAAGTPAGSFVAAATAIARRCAASPSTTSTTSSTCAR